MIKKTYLLGIKNIKTIIILLLTKVHIDMPLKYIHAFTTSNFKN